LRNKKTSTGEEGRNVLVLFLFPVIISIFYWKVLWGGSIFVFVDASRFFYPLWKWGAGVLAQGLIPLWNQDAQFGTPYFADPQMAYAYPPVPILYSLLVPVNAFAALIILHHLWALIGFWFFARSEGFSPKVSFLGSLAFGFSLHVVCSSWTPVALMTISWLPWVFAAAGKVYRKEKGGLFYLSFAWAMQLSAGYPVLVYLTGLAMVLHFGWKTKNPFHHQDTKGPKKGTNSLGLSDHLEKGSLANLAPWWFKNLNWVGWFALSGLTATAYNLVWGLPFAEVLGLSNYENGAGKFHDLNWVDLGTALSPFLQGHPLKADYHGPHYWVSTYYIGLPILCLLLWGAFRRVYQKTSPVLFFIFLVLSLGVLGAGKALKAILPGYSLVVHSGFWLSILLLFAVWMAMESMESFLSQPPLNRGKWVWAGGVAFIYAASLFLQAPLYPGDFWVSAVLLILALYLKPVVLRWGCLGLALVLSLGPAADGLNILLDRSYYEKPPFVLSALPKPGRLFFTPPLMREAGKLQGGTMAQAYETAKQRLYPNWPLAFGREAVPLYNTIQLKKSFAWTFQAFQYSLQHSRDVLDYLGVRYLFGKNQFGNYGKIEAGNGDEVYENPGPLPKWFTVEKAVPAGPAVEEDFAKADREAVDYGKECFIEDPAKAGSYSPRQVTVQPQPPNQSSFATRPSGKGRALVISSECGAPGWKVFAGGKRKAVELINHAFRGVVLEEGENQATFKYEPTAFRLGLFCSLAVCALWACLFLKRIAP